MDHGEKPNRSTATRAIRGATTTKADEPGEIRAEIGRLGRELLIQNSLTANDLIAVWMTVTPDLYSIFAGTAIREELGLDDVPLLGSVEADVEGAPARCVRLMLLAETTLEKSEITHVYLNESAKLRPDLEHAPTATLGVPIEGDTTPTASGQPQGESPEQAATDHTTQSAEFPTELLASAESSQRTANILGVGLIGGSIALGLKEAGWRVFGSDDEPETLQKAKALGAIDGIGLQPDADITFVATPVGLLAQSVSRALDITTGVVCDVGSVKAQLASEINHPRFIATHPMAGSEQNGIKGSRADMFLNATWVLCPTDDTHEKTYSLVRSAVEALGAEVITMNPEEHDEAVARISHVPHLTAATLMKMAANSAVDEQHVLRLAAGGFRDMTRIAAGHPRIWLDICDTNREAIMNALDDLSESLQHAREIVANRDRDGLASLLAEARKARVNLPSGIPQEIGLSEVRVTLPDRPGEIARITTLVPQVNIFDFEIAHSFEGSRGVAIMVIARKDEARMRTKLRDAGYSCSTRTIR